MSASFIFFILQLSLSLPLELYLVVPHVLFYLPSGEVREQEASVRSLMALQIGPCCSPVHRSQVKSVIMLSQSDGEVLEEQEEGIKPVVVESGTD
ncbi:hypothetical protein RUM43_007654 [Polyplax serrata]|uniref:Uncharacterized protein n=1 Tax=Polyplax serrata TaxID=468196 RepID=A0AAN8PMW2_POLSC